MHLGRIAFVILSTVVATACSSGASSPSSGADDPSPGPSAAGSSEATRIEVELTDALQILPASMTVTAGKPVTFVVTNTGATDHEFYLGDEAAQAEHEQEMQSMGGMAHDEPEGIAVEPGETKELMYTFAEAGLTLAGCQVAGHYAGGMKAEITVHG